MVKKTKKKPVNEKTAEILFNRFFLSSFPLGSITFESPTTKEEYNKGYDAKAAGTEHFNEIFLQFKAPSYEGSAFEFVLDKHQQSILHKRAENSAFYVVPMFPEPEKMMEAQRQKTELPDFLSKYRCIEISHLPEETKRIKFTIKMPYIDVSSDSVEYIINKRWCIYGSQHWFSGDELVTKFREGDIGKEFDRVLESRMVTRPEEKMDLEIDNNYSLTGGRYKYYKDLILWKGGLNMRNPTH